jgi:hypothetical protein
VGTNISGTAANLTAGNVTTNANSTGDVTSVGNATTIAHAGATGVTAANNIISALNLATVSGTVPATVGGTGFASYTVGDILYASSTTALSKLAAGASGKVLTSGGAGVAPSWATASGGGGSGTYTIQTTPITTNSSISGSVTMYIVNDGKTITLPAISSTVAGQVIIIVHNQALSSGITINTASAGDKLTDVGITGVINGTSATETFGVYRLVSDGASHWYTF